MQSSRICIYFANTGGGHKSAAKAIAAGIRTLVKKEPAWPRVRITQLSIAEHTHPINKYLIDFYNYLARHRTTWIKYFYKAIHVVQPDNEMFYGLYRTYLHSLLKTDQPNLIVLVHPMLPSCITYALEELKLQSATKVAVVITDPNENLWRGWGANKVDLIVAPNYLVRDRLLSWQIAPDKIKVLGMPINPKFIASPSISRSRFLTKLGLAPDLLTVCINASWAGNTHWLNTYKALAKCNRKLQVIFLSGNNQDLHDLVVAAAKDTNIPTAVLEFNNKMPELMNAVDLMVTKAGGLTTYEALARRLPLVLDNTIPPMPQEAPTMQMMADAKVAKILNSPEDIIEIVEKLPFPRSKDAPLPTSYDLNLTDHSIFDIAQSLLALTAKEIKPSESLRQAA